MQSRKLGWTDLHFTTMGLGAWAMGGAGWRFSWGPQDDADSIATIKRAIDLGINWVDTAAIYGLGHSEEVIGQALKGMSHKPIVATKCSRRWDETGTPYGNLKRDSLRAECEASLKRLGVETIDLYQIHWPNPDADVEEGWGALAELVKEGKLRYIGVCNFSVDQLKRIRPIHPVASLQPPYSMLVRGVEEGLLQYCADNQIGVVAYSPMQKGLLTGKVTREWVGSLAADDHRHRDAMFQEPQLSANLKLVEGLKTIAARNGKTAAQIAIAWVLRRPEVTAAIVGARRPSQIEETAPAGDWALSQDDIRAIDALLAERAKQ
ncbi:MAG: aldo/keto reductase [Chloroflexi bacterium]|nr:aldo/keto reductase [Chloroflexota bacterium]MCL5275773.1 aldo/keto reductase [Chloroflexota bacterium]